MNLGWDTYLTDSKNGSVAVVVDLDARTTPGLDFCLQAQITLKAPGPDGQAKGEEIAELAPSEEAFEKLVRDLDGVYVGRLTMQGRRVFAAYMPSGHVPSPARLGAYPVRLGSRHDPEWDFFSQALFPGSEELQGILNRRTLEQLENQGDELIDAREIAHSAVFAEANAAAEFCSEVMNLGYDPQDPLASAEGWSVKVLRFDRPEWLSINRSTRELLRLVTSLGGSYLGWTCPIHRPDGWIGESLASGCCGGGSCGSGKSPSSSCGTGSCSSPAPAPKSGCGSGGCGCG
ncbi:MAG: hypothetical protein RL095_518 [Verrucomicrobiota bacterium]|jgi:hypothetical protein